MTRDVTTVGPDVQTSWVSCPAGTCSKSSTAATGRSDKTSRLRSASPRLAPEHLDVEVSVDDGIVTLTGTALFPQDVTALTSMTWRMPGVVDVSNHVQSREPDPKPL